MMLVREEYGDATGHETINPTSATGVTSTLITPTTGQYAGFNAKAVLITVETKQVRFTIDGTTVSATVGHIIAAADSYVVTGGQNVKNLSFMDTSSGASTVMVTVYH